MYNWNLGSSSNGWTYNGSPAPQTFSTNTITLVSQSTAQSVSNVQVAVSFNGSTVSNLTSTVTLNKQTASYTILGQEVPCTNSITTYSLQQSIPSGANVVWSIYPNDGSVTYTPNGTSVDVDASNLTTSGYYNLTASITGSCYQGSAFRQFYIPTETWSGNIYGNQGWSNTVYGGPLVQGDNYLYLGNGATFFEVYVNTVFGGGLSNIWWEYVSGDYTPYTNIYRIAYDLSSGGLNGYVDSYYNLHYTDDCGSHTVPFHFMSSNANPPYYRTAQPTKPIQPLLVQPQIKLAPNPAADFVTITITAPATEQSKPGKTKQENNATRTIKVYDKLGNLLLQKEAAIPATGYRLDVSRLKHGDVYNVVIEDKKGNRLSSKLVKQ